jgi:hypothetical protein
MPAVPVNAIESNVFSGFGMIAQALSGFFHEGLLLETLNRNINGHATATGVK